MVQRVIKNRVRAPTHHTGNKSPDTRRGALASLAIHNPCRSRFIAFKRLCIHCTQVNILRLQVTLKPLSPSLPLHWCDGQWDSGTVWDVTERILCHNLYHTAYCERSGLVPQYTYINYSACTLYMNWCAHIRTYTGHAHVDT